MEPQELIVAGLDDSFVDDEDDASSIALPDGASANLIVILRAEIVDVPCIARPLLRKHASP